MDTTAVTPQAPRAGQKSAFPANATTVEFARDLDAQDPLRHLRDEYYIPTKGSLKKTQLTGQIPGGYQRPARFCVAWR
jgi:kynureninase